MEISMKHILAQLAMIVCPLIQILYAENSTFLLSSSEIINTKNDPATLKDISNFVFLFYLKMEKEEIACVLDYFNQELSKIGKVEKKEIFTDQGVDLECFSNCGLHFSLVQLVDSNQRLIPTLKAELVVHGMVDIYRNKAFVPTDIGTWTSYFNQQDHNTMSALKISLPLLLRSFLADYIKANGSDKKPTFFIIF
jgi:hypothetical protein